MRFDYRKLDPHYSGGAVVRSGRLCVIAVNGEITFDDRGWSWYGTMRHSELCEMIRMAARDRTVDEVAFHINCFGGSAFALPDLISAMQELQESKKKTTAAVHGAALSLAYGLASMCDEIVADQCSVVGSVGGRMPTLYDYTKQMAEAGVETFTAKAGTLKDFGSGTTPFNEAGKAMYQDMVAIQVEPFFAIVAEGRGMTIDAVKAMEAAMYVGKSALEKGLVDRIEPFDTTITELVRRTGTGSKLRGTAMDIATLRKDHSDIVATLKAEGADEARKELEAARLKPATFEQLDARFGSDPAFVHACLKGKFTMEKAESENAARMAASLEATNKELAELKSKKPAAPALSLKGSAGVDMSNGTAPSDLSEYGTLCARVAAADAALTPAQVMHKARQANKSAHAAWEKEGRKVLPTGLPS